MEPEPLVGADPPARNGMGCFDRLGGTGCLEGATSCLRGGPLHRNVGCECAVVGIQKSKIKFQDSVADGVVAVAQTRYGSISMWVRPHCRMDWES